MYARIVLFTLGQGMRSTAEEIADGVIPKIKARKGLKNIDFLVNDEAGEYGFLALWETKEDGEAAKEAVFPILQSRLTGTAKGSLTAKLFEVIESKA